jgi:hypothetical protein
MELSGVCLGFEVVRLCFVETSGASSFFGHHGLSHPLQGPFDCVGGHGGKEGPRNRSRLLIDADREDCSDLLQYLSMVEIDD